MSPYVYVGNNPIIYIDPDGRFRTKVGAWLFNFLSGGDGIDKANGEWFSYKRFTWMSDDNTINFFESTVTKWSENTHTQNVGAPVFGIGTNETKATAKETGPGINIANDLLAVRPDAGSHSRSSGLGEAVGKFLSAIQGLLQETKEPVAEGVTAAKETIQDTSGKKWRTNYPAHYHIIDPETGRNRGIIIDSPKDSIEKRRKYKGIWQK